MSTKAISKKPQLQSSKKQAQHVSDNTPRTPKQSRNLVASEVTRWRKLRQKRRCTEFSEMSYWQVVTTCSAL